MEKLLEYIVKSLVENPKAVKVTQDRSENLVTLNLKVDPKDLGLVIGRGGKTIHAIRNLVRLLAIKEGERVNVHLIDEKEERATKEQSRKRKDLPSRPQQEVESLRPKE